MLKLKKFLSVVLTVMMLISSVSVFAEGEAATAALFPDVDSNTVVGKALSELVPLGIINGYEDGTFKPDNTITRAEFSKIIVTFLNIQNVGAEGLVSGFPDVDTATPHWAQKFIRLAVDKGIVNGYNDGTFKPDNPVKYSEAVKMIVCALNYGDVALSRTPAAGPWYAGYVAQAADLGILKNVTVNGQEDPASRGTVAILVANALDADVATVTTTTGGASSTTSSGTTAREEFLNSSKITGVVVSCQQTNLGVTDAESKIRLVGIDTGNKVVTYKVPSGTDTMSLLGYKITANINAESVDEYPEISSITRANTNKTITIDASLIDSATIGSIDYWESESSTKRLTANFENEVAVVYNGKYLGSSGVGYTADDFMIDAGNIVLVSNDGDSSGDVVFVNDCEIFAVSGSGVDSDTKLKKIYTLYNSGDILVPEKSTFVTVNNKGTDVTDTTSFSVSKYDIINLYRSKDGEVFNMTVTRNKKSGKITETSKTGIAIANKEYEFAYNFANYDGADKPVFSTGNNANVYLDAEGKIAAAENTSTSADSSIYLGYMISAEKGEGINGKNQIRMYGMSSGKTGERTYELASKIRVDGTQLSDSAAAVDLLAEAAKTANANKSKMGVTLTQYSQLIRFTLNSDNKVDTIDTVTPNATVANDDMIQSLPFPNTADSKYGTADWKGTYRYVSGNVFQNDMGGTVMGINSSTKVIVVPQEAEDVSGYKNTSMSYFTSQLKYQVEGYCLNDTKIAQYVVVYASENDVDITDTSDIVIAGNVTQSQSELEDLTVQDTLTGWNFKTGAAVSDLRAEEEDMFYGKIQAGEIFRYALNDKYVSKVEMIFEIEDGKPVLFREQLSANGITNALDPVATQLDAKGRRDIQFDDGLRTENASTARVIYGTVVSKSEDDNGSNRAITLTNTLATDTNGLDTENVNIFKMSSSVKIFTLDLKETNESKMITEEVDFNELRPALELGSSDTEADASQVLMFYSGGTIRTMFIIKR